MIPRATTHSASAQATRPARAGFSIVELVVALIILTIGVLGLASTTAFVIRQVSLADVNTQRAAALQFAIERIRATPWDSVGTGSRALGSVDVSWSVTDSTGQTKDVRVITLGPGIASAGSALRDNVPDTFSFMVLRP